jgi:hypothetical protein
MLKLTLPCQTVLQSSSKASRTACLPKTFTSTLRSPNFPSSHFMTLGQSQTSLESAAFRETPLLTVRSTKGDKFRFTTGTLQTCCLRLEVTRRMVSGHLHVPIMSMPEVRLTAVRPIAFQRTVPTLPAKVLRAGLRGQQP